MRDVSRGSLEEAHLELLPQHFLQLVNFLYSMNITGTWKLLSCEAKSMAGAVERLYGKSPFGRLTYGGDGRMSVIIFDPEVWVSVGGGTQNPVCADPETVPGFLAYCGSFRLDIVQGKVTHFIEGCNILSWIGSEQERFFQINQNRLEIRTAPYSRLGQEWIATLLWEKL